MLHANIFLECFAANIYVDLDVLEPDMPRLILDKIKVLRDHFANMGAPQDVLDSPHLATVDLMLTGWSKSAGRMRCIHFSLLPEDCAVSVEPIDGSRIAPGEILEPAEVIQPTSVGAMERLARMQLAAARRQGVDGQGFGGSLLIVELTRDEMRVRRRSVFPKN